jgi:hypothetical protein
MNKISSSKKSGATPITKKEDIQNNPDNKIDEDFPGYPHGSSKDKIIKPQTEGEKQVADIDNKDGEKRNKKEQAPVDESRSDGSGGAFEATEEVAE